MTLDRWIALTFLLFCLTYGYTAFFVMDGQLAPFLKNNPIWPSTFPKVLSVGGIIIGLFVLIGFEKSTKTDEPMEINYRRLTDYKLGQALTFLGLMVAYALALYPIGFLLSTTLFLILGGVILGERNLKVLVPVSLFATGFVWWLVQVVLGIFLRPLPFFL